MNKLFLTVVLLILLTFSTNASELKVSKVASEDNLESGDLLNLNLIITNSDPQPVMIKIEDENWVGKSGLVIDCMEKIVEGNETCTVKYPPFMVYEGGNYTLPPATIRFTDPDTGRERSLQTNDLNLHVEPGEVGVRHEDVIRIYKCDGISKTSGSKRISTYERFHSNLPKEWQTPLEKLLPRETWSVWPEKFWSENWQDQSQFRTGPFYESERDMKQKYNYFWLVLPILMIAVVYLAHRWNRSKPRIEICEKRADSKTEADEHLDLTEKERTKKL
ncbi:MAG: hypothetical protein ACXQT4_02075 [Methanotrichaceae archaeon]